MTLGFCSYCLCIIIVTIADQYCTIIPPSGILRYRHLISFSFPCSTKSRQFQDKFPSPHSNQMAPRGHFGVEILEQS